MCSTMEINDIIEGISIKLNSVFGDGYTIYDGGVPQGFKTPSFLVLFLSLEQSQRIGSLRRITTLFNIQYFTDKGRTDASNHALKVPLALNEITLIDGSIMRGANPNSEIVDGNAHNFINFNFTIKEVEVAEFMESIEVHSKRG